MVIDACTELAVRVVKNGGDTGLLEAKSSGGLKNYVKSWLGGAESEEAPKEEEEAPVDSVLVVVGCVFTSSINRL
jgi:hypothetical protein